ncbi:MAG: hypothetical protein PHQ65_10745 [Bacteroidales bacterium]|nr:hypothetical protein [Bacteroidales bacterium]
MFVSGFTIVRNAVLYDYPIQEAIRSVLPLCDEFIVAVGRSDDDTLGLIRGLSDPKIKIVETEWDMNLREGGRVLAVETDKALAAVSTQADWAFYIQADEVLHESCHAAVKACMQQHLNNKNVQGLLFDYTHFYGSYDFVGDSRRWYRREVRVVRPGIGIASYRDAQGFRLDGKPLKVKHSRAWIFHYGWVKPPEKQQAKQQNFHKMWHSDEWVKRNVKQVVAFDYSEIDSLAPFRGTHPRVMEKRIREKNWSFDFNPSRKRFGVKAWILWYFEKLTGIRPGEYKNYKLI